MNTIFHAFETILMNLPYEMQQQRSKVEAVGLEITEWLGLSNTQANGFKLNLCFEHLRLGSNPIPEIHRRYEKRNLPY